MSDLDDDVIADKNSIRVAVACRNASGMADMPIFTVEVTGLEYDLGSHYVMAEACAIDAGYEGPFVCFDPVEQRAIHEAGRSLTGTSPATPASPAG